MFEDCEFSETTFQSCTFTNVIFKNCEWKSAQFNECELLKVDFSKENLNSVKFVGSEIQYCSFAHVTLSNCRFEKGKISFSDFFGIVSKRYGNSTFSIKSEFLNLVDGGRFSYENFINRSGMKQHLYKADITRVSNSLKHGKTGRIQKLKNMALMLPHFPSMIEKYKIQLEKIVEALYRKRIFDNQNITPEFKEWIGLLGLKPEQYPPVQDPHLSQNTSKFTFFPLESKILENYDKSKLKPEVYNALRFMLDLEKSKVITKKSTKITHQRLNKLGTKLEIDPSPYTSFVELLTHMGYFQQEKKRYYGSQPSGKYAKFQCKKCLRIYFNHSMGKYCSGCISWYCRTCLGEPEIDFLNWDSSVINQSNHWSCETCRNIDTSSPELLLPEDLESLKRPVTPKDTLTNFHISLDQVKKSYYHQNYDISYFVKLANTLLKPSSSFMYKPLNEEKFSVPNPIILRTASLQNLMAIIQNNQMKQFSDLSFWVLENVAKYGGNPHYYLKILVEEPGKAINIPKTKKDVPACQACDTMLLRYSFRYVIQQDDLLASTCPYCHEPLQIKYRKNRPIKVTLNFEEKDCTVGLDRAQIGLIYSGKAIKSTINPKGIQNFIENYQNLFTNGIMGPLMLKFDENNSLLFEPIVSMEISWRPAELYPEDLLNFR